MAAIANPLKESPNEVILDAIREDGSSDYQRRIPAATKAGVQATMKQLLTHRTLYNEFLDQLVNRIGATIARNNNWTNPLGMFKRGVLEFGNTIEEIQVGLIEAKNYEPDREHLERDIFGTHRAEVQANFHTVNRQDYYPITVNQPQLKRAFLEDMGLNTFINKFLEAPSTSDQWDEFLLMCQLFPEYAGNGGYFKVHVPDVSVLTSSQDDAKAVLRQMRAMAGKLTFLSTRYNAAKMPTFANREELVIFCTPDFNAAIDVEALAGAFNLDKASMIGRIIEIPEEQFGIDGAQAIMTTTDFFVVADQLFENTSQWNPVSLQNNYFLHHWQIISASRFAPAILFWTGAGDDILEVSTPVTGVTAITATQGQDDGTEVSIVDGGGVAQVVRGEVYQFSATATTSPANGVNDAVRWSVVGATDPRTYITYNGVLHVGGQEAGSSITVTATSTWLDPSNLLHDGDTATISVAVSGNAIPDWPINGSVWETVTGITVDGVAVPAFAAGTETYAINLPVADGAVTVDEVTVAGPDAGDVIVTVGNTAHTPPVAGDTQTVTVSSPASPGDPVYTVTVTFQ